MMKKILFILAVALIGLTACQDKNQKNGNNPTGAPMAFLNMVNEGVFLNGIILFEKDLDRHQISQNNVRMTYRIQDDEQTEYLHFSLQASVSEIGKPTSITVKTAGILYLNQGNYAVVLSQVKDGKAWYWCKDESMGFLMPSF